KDPLAASMSWFELLGACRFSHWDPETGAPVGRRLGSEAHIQIIAVSLTQTQSTSRFLGAVLTDKAKDTFDVDLGKEVIYAHGRQAQIQCVTSSSRATDGAPPAFALRNETHPWVTGNDGHLMGEAAWGNVSKIDDARMLDITNAYMPGEDSVAQRM